jgi:two-component system sensor histidine kinase CpxA
MSRLRIPIYAKVLLWFVINLLLLATLAYGFMRIQFRLSLDWMLAGPTGVRIEQIANALSDELARTPEADWPFVLERHDILRGIHFTLFSSDGRQLLGKAVDVPKDVRVRLIDRRVPVQRAERQRQGFGLQSRQQKDESPPPKPRFILGTVNPSRYWAGIHLDLLYHEAGLGLPLTLVMISDSLIAGGLFFNPWPWLALAAFGMAASLLLWLPLVTGMTRAIGRINTAARRIAHGDFDERVPESRNDELGELAASVNVMASQLGDYVLQQRRITADVAHELCSPIARMQMALGVIEQRGTADQAIYLKKIDAELQHMAKLVEEVMTFARAEALLDQVQSENVRLDEMLKSLVQREGSGVDIHISCDAMLVVHVPREALERAISNLLRNAVRYAGAAGPIEILATHDNTQVCLCVADRGPGVPDDALPQLFDPFYRVDPARSRTSGGAGLGLAIARRCVEACGGDIQAMSAAPHGLKIEISLPADRFYLRLESSTDQMKNLT